MSTPTYGPVDLVVIGFDAEEPPEGVIAAVTDLVMQETILLLDLLLVRRTEDGYVIVEINEVADEYGFPAFELAAAGFTTEEDVAEVSATMPVGSSALIIEVENTWARNFVKAVLDVDAEVLLSARIPADVVNEAIRSEGAKS